MGSGSKQKSQTESWGWSGPEQWVRDEGRGLYDKASALVAANPTYKPYKGEGVAKFDPGMFGDVKGAIESLLAGNGDYNTTRSVLDELRGTVDPNKTVRDYMSDYTGAALQPTLNKIRESGQLARNQIDSQATMAGAFGDSAHGVLEAQQMRDQAQNEGDATAQAYDKAFTNAQQTRAAELARLLGIGQQYQSLGGAEAAQKAGAANMLDALMGQDRNVRQAQDTFDYGQWQQKQKYPYEQLTWLQQILRGTPALNTSDNQSIGISKTSDNSLAGLAGQLLGGFLGGNYSIPGAGGLSGGAGGLGEAGSAAATIAGLVGL